MDASYYIKGQPPNAAIYHMHSAGIKFTDDELATDYPWLPTVPVKGRASFILANAALVAAVEGIRFGIVSKEEGEYTLKIARETIEEFKVKYDRPSSPS